MNDNPLAINDDDDYKFLEEKEKLQETEAEIEENIEEARRHNEV